MYPPGAEFLAKYVEDNIGKYGAIGRAPLGAAGFVAGMPGIGPEGTVVPGLKKPELLGGVTGGLIGGLLG